MDFKLATGTSSLSCRKKYERRSRKQLFKYRSNHDRNLPSTAFTISPVSLAALHSIPLIDSSIMPDFMHVPWNKLVGDTESTRTKVSPPFFCSSRERVRPNHRLLTKIVFVSFYDGNPMPTLTPRSDGAPSIDTPEVGVTTLEGSLPRIVTPCFLCVAAAVLVQGKPNLFNIRTLSWTFSYSPGLRTLSFESRTTFLEGTFDLAPMPGLFLFRPPLASTSCQWISDHYCWNRSWHNSLLLFSTALCRRRWNPCLLLRWMNTVGESTTHNREVTPGGRFGRMGVIPMLSFERFNGLVW